MKKIISLLLIGAAAGAVMGFSMNELQKMNSSFAYNAPIKPELGASIEQTTSQSSPTSSPFKNPEVKAASALLLEITVDGQENLIFAKNPEQATPIASLTKLMTAIIAAEFYRQNEGIIVSEQAVKQMDASGDLNTGEQLKVEKLLKIMLIESSNDAAFALTELMGGQEGFIALMNLKAKDLGLKSTHFFNVNGLDPEDAGLAVNQINYSTVSDLAEITRYIINYHPEIMDMLNKKESALYSDDGQFYHQLTSTNELLGKIPSIIGGKTGTTERAGGCLVLILQGKNHGDTAIAIVLNSPDKFKDMENLVNAYGF